jgi:hypothetical protein
VITRQQQQDALAAIYGLQETSMQHHPSQAHPGAGPAGFSDMEIERMRAIVNHHDAKQETIREFDLNNPPRSNYVYRPFPKMVFSVDDEGNGVHKIVNDEAEHKAAMAEGWQNEPVAAEEFQGTELDAAAASEAEALDDKLAQARAAKKKRK